MYLVLCTESFARVPALKRELVASLRGALTWPCEITLKRQALKKEDVHIIQLIIGSSLLEEGTVPVLEDVHLFGSQVIPQMGPFRKQLFERKMAMRL